MPTPPSQEQEFHLPYELLLVVLSKLNSRALFRAMLVSATWKKGCEEVLKKALQQALNENEIGLYFTLPRVIRHIIAFHLIDYNKITETKQYFELLPKTINERMQALDLMGHKIWFNIMPNISTNDSLPELFSSASVLFYCYQLLTIHQVKKLPAFLSNDPEMMTILGISTSQIDQDVTPVLTFSREVNRIRQQTQITDDLILEALNRALVASRSDRSQYVLERLPSPLNYIALIALHELLLTPAQILRIFHSKKEIKGANGYYNSDLKILLSEAGLQALREDLITPEDTKDISIWGLNALISPMGLKVLRNKLITVDQAKKFGVGYKTCAPYDNLAVLLTEEGLLALQEKLITPDDAAYIYRLRLLLSPIGLTALRERLITPSQARKLYDSHMVGGCQDNLGVLLAEKGLLALRERLFTPDDAVYIRNLGYILENTQWMGFLRERLVTLTQLNVASARVISLLEDESILFALRNGLAQFDELINSELLDYDVVRVKNMVKDFKSSQEDAQTGISEEFLFVDFNDLIPRGQQTESRVNAQEAFLDDPVPDIGITFQPMFPSPPSHISRPHI